MKDGSKIYAMNRITVDDAGMREEARVNPDCEEDDGKVRLSIREW